MCRLRRAPTLRLVSLVLAFFAVGGQLALFAHLVAVDHVACEHGELVEIGHHEARALVRAVARQTTLKGAPKGEHRGHEHCLLGPMRRDRIDGAPRAVHVAIVCDPVELGPARAGEALEPPIPLVLLAPKSSPPQA